jgi:hypothetical protein
MRATAQGLHGFSKISQRVGVGVIVAGLLLTLISTTWGFGYLCLMVGVFLLMWRPRFGLGTMALLALAALVGASILQFPGGWLRERRQQAAAQVQAAELRSRNEARIRSTFEQMQQSMSAGQWRQAATLNTQVKVFNPAFPGRADAESTINNHIRLLDIDDGIAAAEKVVSDVAQCKQPTAIATAWNKVRQVRSSDPQWASASALVAKIEACRQRAEQDLSAAMSTLMVVQREGWARNADKVFLDKGMNVDISLDGVRKDHATLKWALMSRAAAYKLTDGGSLAPTSLLGGMQKIGFKRVTFRGIFDESWSYTLEPQDESNGGATLLAKNGIGQPLKLVP